MGEWSRETHWRQGSVLPDDASKALELSHPESPERTFVVVISHDCDLAADPDREPLVELVPKHFNYETNGQLYTWPLGHVAGQGGDEDAGYALYS